MSPEGFGARALPSEAEIGVLDALAAQGEPLSARLGPEGPVLATRLLRVDPRRGFLLFARSGDRGADEMLLARRRIAFEVEWGEWRIAFEGEGPVPDSHDGTDAFRCRFPASVSIHRRRMHERFAVDPGAIRCVAYSGAVAVFEARVTDISQGGLGLQAEAAGVRLDPGTVLPGCRIERGGAEPLVIDLEVRHTALATGPDGRRLLRAGCRFVNPSPAFLDAVSGLARRKAA